MKTTCTPRRRASAPLRLATLLALAAPAAAQTLSPPVAEPDVLPPHVTNVVVPQRRSLPIRPGATALAITGVDVLANIDGRVATTTLEVSLHNPGARPEEAVVVLPLPDGAVLRAFGFDGVGPEPTARILPADEARRLYESIVSSMRDPALLEFAGYRLVRSSAFPIPARTTQKITLVYECLLGGDGSRVDYVLPRSEAFDTAAIRWNIDVQITSEHPIATVYSPTHAIETEHRASRRVRITAGPDALRQPGPFQLSYVGSHSELSATILAHPDTEAGGGTFLLLCGIPPVEDEAARKPMDREVTIVLDRSGSMRGNKIEQAREAALQVLEGLRFGEAFNIVDYSDTIGSFAARPVPKDAESIAEAREYLASLRPVGGTNIGDALLLALEQPSRPGTLPIVLFLTDGLPTIGITAEKPLREAVAAANAAGRRIFTFGVGFDVNAPLLDHIAKTSRATSTYVRPADDVEVAVGRVFRRLAGPVLAEPRLRVLDAHGMETTRALFDILPQRLPDVFEGDQLVILGKYRGSEKLHLRLQGTHHGEIRDFALTFDPATASLSHSYVPRLWASRRIAFLTDEIRQSGVVGREAVERDPRLAELVREIVELSCRFGILTEYTAFLATEPGREHLAGGPGGDVFDGPSTLPGTGPSAPGFGEPAARASEVLVGRVVEDREGASGINQALNLRAESERKWLNKLNAYLDEDLETRSFASIAQLPEETYFQRGRRWIDARILRASTADREDEIVEFATPEYFALAAELAREGRQAALALGGEILLQRDGKNVLVKAP